MAEQDDPFEDRVDDDGFGTFASGDESADDDRTRAIGRSSVWAGAAGEELDELDDPWGREASAGVTALGGGDSLDVGPPTGSVALPDWKDPPTGQVPRIVAAGPDDEWAARTGSQPSWRGDDDWATTDFDDGLLDDDTGEVNMGALDSNRSPVSSAFSFEDDLPSGGQPIVQIGVEDASVPPGTAGAGATTVAPIRSRTRPDDDGPTPPAGGRDMQVAAMVGVGFALAAIAAFLFGDLVGPFLLSTVVVLVCAWELFTGFQRGGLRPATLLGLTSCLALMAGTYARGVSAIPLVLVLTFAGSMLWYLSKVIHARVILGVGTTMLGVGWIGVLGSYSALLLHDFPAVGKSWLLAAILCTVAADVTALAGGSIFGRTPLAPDASPNKTWEGAFTGFVGAVIMGALVGTIDAGVGTSRGIILGVAVGVVAPIGDLCQSLVKRDLGVKDMGTALPGHGGFLDRFDSLLFVLPTAYYIASRYFG